MAKIVKLKSTNKPKPVQDEKKEDLKVVIKDMKDLLDKIENNLSDDETRKEKDPDSRR